MYHLQSYDKFVVERNIHNHPMSPPFFPVGFATLAVVYSYLGSPLEQMHRCPLYLGAYLTFAVTQLFGETLR